MKKKNIKDDILRILLSNQVPLLTHNDLYSRVEYEKSEISFAILELEKSNHLAVIKPYTKGELLTYSLTQDGELFIRHTSYYQQNRKSNINTFYKIADKSITILGILTGVIFGINSCSTENKNDKLIYLISKKDSIINNRNTDLLKFNKKFDSIDYELNILNQKLNKQKSVSTKMKQ